jgi:glycosyltransferase involved in cell wall biosynthesis
MQIVLLEPFMTGSHSAWAKQYQTHSRHDIEILGLDGKYWKWRMHGGAVSLAHQFIDEGLQPDLLLATDMLDLTTFLALTRSVTADIPVALYFHENQLSYPWSPDDADPALKRDAHYCFINYSSALAADAVLFNSDFHRCDFLAELPKFLSSFPDYNERESVQAITAKSQTLHLGLDLKRFDQYRADVDNEGARPPLLLWNHRWEYDKNPEDFFRVLFILQDQGIEFELVVLGESYQKQPAIFEEAHSRLASQIIHWGYAESFAEYAYWLWRADVLPVTSIHDFFGISVVEAIYCDCFPLLPDRLAYPEHLPKEQSDHYLYPDFNGLVTRLKRCCQEIEILRSEPLSVPISHYDWSAAAPEYDNLLEQLAFQRKSG